MFRRTLRSTSGKIAGSALALVGMVGGWTLTADLGGFELASTGVVSAASPGYQPGTVLDFPSAVLAVEQAPAGPTETVVENMGNLQMSYEVPAVVAPPAPKPAPACVGELTATVAGLGDSVVGIVTAQDAAAALEQANALGAAANACAQQVSTLGSSGMDQLAQLGQQLNGLVGTIQALPVSPAPAPSPTEGSAGPMDAPIEKSLEVFGDGLGMTLDAVNGLTGEVGGLLGSLLNPTG